MTRIITDIPDQDIKAMDEIAAAEGISRAELIRQMVSEGIEKKGKPKKKDWEKYFGLWNKDGKNPIDGVEYENEIRSEWDGRP